MSYINRADAKRLISEFCNECLESCAEFDGIYPDCDKCLLHGVKSELEEIPAADVVPWEFLERYADFFCAMVSMPEFIREAKAFYKDTQNAMESGNICGADMRGGAKE